MTRPKRGEPGHELAVKRQHETMLKNLGSEEAVRRHFKEMGRKGGLKTCRKGFATDPNKARRAGAAGGAKSIRGCQFIREDEYTRWYKRRDTGEIVKYVYDITKDKYVLDKPSTIMEDIKNENWI